MLLKFKAGKHRQFLHCRFDRKGRKMENFHDLVAGARSYRRFDESKAMTDEDMTSLIELGRITPCGGNRQYIRFAYSCDQERNKEIFKQTGWAAYLTDWDGPAEGERPTGYILILRDLSLQKNLTVDEGIVAQTINLGARAMGLGCCMLMNIKRDKLMEIFGLDPEKYAISMVIALGVPVETVKIVPLKDNDVKYYRDENMVHYVPKRSLEDVLVK